MPFCTTSWALLISRATLALASNVCGSVFGLLMIADACTYWPPTCCSTLVYSFSAPMATILWADVVDEPVVPDEQALTARATPAATATASVRRGARPVLGNPILGDMAVMIIISIWLGQSDPVTCGCDHLAIGPRHPRLRRGRPAAGDPGPRHPAVGRAGGGAGQPARLLQRPADSRRAAAPGRAHRADHRVPAPAGAERGRQRRLDPGRPRRDAVPAVPDQRAPPPPDLPGLRAQRRGRGPRGRAVGREGGPGERVHRGRAHGGVVRPVPGLRRPVKPFLKLKKAHGPDQVLVSAWSDPPRPPDLVDPGASLLAGAPRQAAIAGSAEAGVSAS